MGGAASVANKPQQRPRIKWLDEDECMETWESIREAHFLATAKQEMAIHMRTKSFTSLNGRSKKRASRNGDDIILGRRESTKSLPNSKLNYNRPVRKNDIPYIMIIPPDD